MSGMSTKVMPRLEGLQGNVCRGEQKEQLIGSDESECTQAQNRPTQVEDSEASCAASKQQRSSSWSSCNILVNLIPFPAFGSQVTTVPSASTVPSIFLAISSLVSFANVNIRATRRCSRESDSGPGCCKKCRRILAPAASHSRATPS